MHTTGSSYGGQALYQGQEPAPTDTKAAREARRREIDVLLREDARACPGFAVARLRAVMATMEPPPLCLATVPTGEQRDAFHDALASISIESTLRLPCKIEAVDEHRDTAQMARDILAELHRYEAHRGGERRPRRDLTRWLPAHVGEAVEVRDAEGRLVITSERRTRIMAPSPQPPISLHPPRRDLSRSERRRAARSRGGNWRWAPGRRRSLRVARWTFEFERSTTSPSQIVLEARRYRLGAIDVLIYALNGIVTKGDLVDVDRLLRRMSA